MGASYGRGGCAGRLEAGRSRAFGGQDEFLTLGQKDGFSSLSGDVFASLLFFLLHAGASGVMYENSAFGH